MSAASTHSPRLTSDRKRRAANVLSRLAVATGLSAIVCMAVYVAGGFHHVSAATVSASTQDCTISLKFTTTSVQADMLSGCTGGDFYLSSWAAQSDAYSSSKPQHFFAATNQAPWIVPLPPCYWQVDFARRTAAPPNGQRTEFVAGRLGGKSCYVPPTTTATTVATTSSTAPSTTMSATTTTAAPPLVSNQSTSAASGSTATAVSAAPTDGSTTTLAPPVALSGHLAFTGANDLLIVLAGLTAITLGMAALASSWKRGSKS